MRSGVLVDLRGAANLLDPAAVHDDDLIGKSHGFALVVGNIYAGDADALLDLANFRTHVHTQLGVQIGQRFIKEQNGRLHDQGPGQGHALLLTAGQLVGHPVFHALQAYQFQHVHNLCFDGLFVHLLIYKAVAYVIIHIVMGKQRIALKHHTGVPLVRGQLVDAHAVQQNLAFADAFKARDHTQGRGLAAAGRSQQGHELAAGDIHVDVVHR